MPDRSTQLSYGSLFVYPSKGWTDTCVQMKADVLAIKNDRPRPDGERWPEYAARLLLEHLPGSALEGYFDGDPWLVPIPNSGLLQPDGLWSALRICEALHAQGIGSRVEPALKREHAVPKQAGGSRQPPETHYLSFGRVLPLKTDRVILVDDVVTRGATALGAAWSILEAMPGADVKLFAMARTVWTPEEVRGFVEVVRGTITQESHNYLRRVP